MKANEKSFLEKLCLHFHDDIEVLKEVFRPKEVERIIRIRALYKEILCHPMEPDYKRTRWLMERFGIQERQAYYDLADLRVAVGPSLSFDKNFERHELAQGIREMMSVAMKKEDTKSFSALAEKLDSILRLSKDDAELVKKDLAPMSIEPTNDVTVLGLPPLNEDENLLKDRIRSRFNKMAKDVEYQEVLKDGTNPFYYTPTRKEKKTAKQDVKEE